MGGKFLCPIGVNSLSESLRTLHIYILMLVDCNILRPLSSIDSPFGPDNPPNSQQIWDVFLVIPSIEFFLHLRLHIDTHRSVSHQRRYAW